MGRKSKKNGPFSYFSKLFTENQALLKETKNDGIKAQYRKDHGLSDGAKLDEKVMDALANTKSRLRKKFGVEIKRGRGARKGVQRAAKMAKSPSVTPDAKLEFLEDRIDECLVMARGLQSESLDRVIQLLKRARNRVVLTRDERAG